MSDIHQTDLIAENARLLDRLTKQQEINQSLRVENAQLKAEIKEWRKRAAGINIVSRLVERDEEIAQLKENKKDLQESIQLIKDNIKECQAGTDGGQYDLVPKKALDELKANHGSDKRKACLSAKYFAWRDSWLGHAESDYSVEDEAEWVIGEATNIQDAVDIFNEFYGDECCCEESIYQLKCDVANWRTAASGNWELNQLWMDDEGNFTLTEEEFQRNNADEEEKKSCDFCDKERKVLTKRDAGYEEWTCSTCHKEQYPEEYEEKQ